MFLSIGEFTHLSSCCTQLRGCGARREIGVGGWTRLLVLAVAAQLRGCGEIGVGGWVRVLTSAVAVRNCGGDGVRVPVRVTLFEI